MAALGYVFLAVLAISVQAQVIPCQQSITAAPEVVTIIDNSVSNSLANALQLLIVSNLIQNTLNSPAANTLATLACETPIQTYPIEYDYLNYNPYSYSSCDVISPVVDFLPNLYQDLPINIQYGYDAPNYGYPIPNSGVASVCAPNTGCQNVAYEVIPNYYNSPCDCAAPVTVTAVNDYSNVGYSYPVSYQNGYEVVNVPYQNVGYEILTPPCQNVGYEILTPPCQNVGYEILTPPCQNVGYEILSPPCQNCGYEILTPPCQNVGYEVLSNVGPNCGSNFGPNYGPNVYYDRPVPNFGAEVLLQGPGQVSCGCGNSPFAPNLPCGSNLPLGPNLPCGGNLPGGLNLPCGFNLPGGLNMPFGPNIESLLQSYANKILGKGFNF